MHIIDIIDLLIAKKGSDIHLAVGSPPMLRVDGKLFPIEGAPSLDKKSAETLINPLMTSEQKNYVLVNLEVDFAYSYKDQGRFRVNVYHTQGTLAAALRLIPTRVKTIEELQLPAIFHKLIEYRQGLVLLTGPTGEGKSTTLAAMIEEINSTRSDHILTIEDPIEFVYTPKRSLISQREIRQDTNNWEIALRSALREDPDVVLVGEMRDYETIASAITVAETGHLVFATLHTNSAAQTIDRIIDVFPEHQQEQIRQQLSSAIQAVVAQRLVPKNGGGRVAATEIMIATPAIKNLIRENKTFQIDNIIQTSAESGMMLMETSLLNWAQRGAISMEKAREYSVRPAEFDRLSKGKE